MKAHVILKNFDSESCRNIIVRNLNRILDIRIIYFDLENGALHFLCNGPIAFEQVKRELSRIGFPIQEYRFEPPTNDKLVVRYVDRALA